MQNRTFVLADGENLVFRYQDSLQEGFGKRKETYHIPNVFVWHPSFTKFFFMETIRVSYYTTQVGSENELEQTREKIASYSYDFHLSGSGPREKGYLCPYVFKKDTAKRQKA
jgi:hypothetical protein